MKFQFARKTLIVLSIGASVPLFARAATSVDSPRSVTVQGTGKVQGVPDIAMLQVEVSQEGASLDSVSATVRKGMSAITALLKKESIADKDLQTQSYQVSPLYEQDKRGNAHRSGYRVTNVLSVKIRDLAKVGRVLTLVTQAGATQVSGPEFGIDNPDALEREALAKAIENAKSRAAILARGAGAILGDVWTIQQQGTSWPGPRPMMAMKAMALSADAAAEPVSAGEQTVQVTITATFFLK